MVKKFWVKRSILLDHTFTSFFALFFSMFTFWFAITFYEHNRRTEGSTLIFTYFGLAVLVFGFVFLLSTGILLILDSLLTCIVLSDSGIYYRTLTYTIYGQWKDLANISLSEADPYLEFKTSRVEKKKTFLKGKYLVRENIIPLAEVIDGQSMIRKTEWEKNRFLIELKKLLPISSDFVDKCFETQNFSFDDAKIYNRLSAKEQQVIKYICTGQSDEQVYSKLRTSQKRLSIMIAKICKKFKVVDRIQLKEKFREVDFHSLDITER